MIIKEVFPKSILNPSKVFDWCLNPYLGCQHNCLYCYATFMARWHHPGEEWGSFVDVKLNAPIILSKQLGKIKRGKIWISGVTDPYQPIEEKYKLTRHCLRILKACQYPDQISIQTKSDLVLRDIDILKKLPSLQVTFTITTTDNRVAKLFEKFASPPSRRLQALQILKKENIPRAVMVAPILPWFGDSEKSLKQTFIKIVNVGVNAIYLDRMNYINGRVGERIRPLYKKFGKRATEYLEYAKTPEYQQLIKRRVSKISQNIPTKIKIYF